jgi:hypothetical protein
MFENIRGDLKAVPDNSIGVPAVIKSRTAEEAIESQG